MDRAKTNRRQLVDYDRELHNRYRIVQQASSRTALDQAWRAFLSHFQTIDAFFARCKRSLPAADFDEAIELELLQWKDSFDSLKEEARRLWVDLSNRYQLADRSALLRRRSSASSSAASRKASLGGGGGAVQATQDVTDELASLSRSLATTVAQSTESLQALGRTSDSIGQVNRSLERGHSNISRSHYLLRHIEWKSFIDAFRILLAFLLFFGVCFYIVNKRVLRRF